MFEHINEKGLIISIFMYVIILRLKDNETQVNCPDLIFVKFRYSFEI